MKDKLYIFWTFIKSHKWIVLFSFILILANIVITNNIIDSDVESSRESLESQMRDVSIAVRTDYVPLVTYREQEKPSVLNYIKRCAYKRRNPFTTYKEEDCINWNDTLSYNQIYAHIEHYFEAMSGWDVVTYTYEHEHIVETTISPIAFGVYANYTANPTDAFDYLYESLIGEGSAFRVINESKWNDLDMESDYHNLSKYNYQRVLALSRDTFWYDMPYGKIFFEKDKTSAYFIETKETKIFIQKTLYVLIITLCEAVIAFLIVKAIRASRRIKHRLSLNWKTLLPKKRRETSACVEYSALLQKLNPVNFMHPYDAEKVRIANDLYSALLKSKDNDTIIRMIYEKAKDELGII